MTAEDFVWSLRRSLHPDMGNQLAYLLFPIVGAEAFSKGELVDPENNCASGGSIILSITGSGFVSFKGMEG